MNLAELKDAADREDRVAALTDAELAAALAEIEARAEWDADWLDLYDAVNGEVVDRWVRGLEEKGEPRMDANGRE